MDKVIKMKLTSIQLYDDTKKKLERKKVHERDTYDSVIKRMLEEEDIPSMEDMFRQADKIKEQKKYTTKELLELIHARRGKI